MRILLYEIRKIMRPSVLAVLFVLYAVAATAIGPLAYVQYSYNAFNGEYSSADNGKHTETVVKDMLMERYGISLEGEELFDFIEFHKEYWENLNKAVSENEYCKLYGITNAEDLTLSAYDILGEEYYVRDAEGYIKQVKEDEVSRFFSNAMYNEFEYDGQVYIPEVGSWLNSSLWHIQSGFEKYGEDYVYYIFNSAIANKVGMDIPILLCSTLLCAMLAIIPYGVKDKMSGVEDVQYCAKTGKRIYIYKISAVLVASLIFMLTGIAIAAVYYRCLGVERFNGTFLNSYFDAFGGFDMNKVYSGITVIDLIRIFYVCSLVFGIVLCAGVYIICEKCRNPITASASCIPIFAVMIFCGYRYLSGCVYSCNHSLLFKGEGIAVLAVLSAVCICAVIFDYRRLKKNLT